MPWIAENAKAWVALVVAILSIITVHFGIDFSWLSEEAIVAIIGIVGAIFVWLVPNTE